jgi:hypothetical protein
MKNFAVLMLLVSGLFLIEGCSGPCKDVSCLNGGTCDGETGDCQCASGYEGADCGTAINAKFVGTWNVTEACVNSDTLNQSYQLIVAPISGYPDSLTLTGIWNFPNYTIRAKVGLDGLSIGFSRQEMSFVDAFESVNGQISMDNATLNITYNWYALGSSTPTRVCQLVGNK